MLDEIHLCSYNLLILKRICKYHVHASRASKIAKCVVDNLPIFTYVWVYENGANKRTEIEAQAGVIFLARNQSRRYKN